MQLTDREHPILTDLADKPNLEALRTELDRCLNESSGYLDQYRRDFEARFCLWEGQSPDGRRWQQNLGSSQKVKPWEGSSDVRTFTADDVINEQVDVMLSAYHRATIQVTALQSTQLDWSQKVTILLQWMLRNHLAPELSRELEKAAQWRETYGVAVLGIWWRQDWRLTQTLITLAEMLEKAAALAEQGNPEPLLAIADPLQDERTVAQMIARSPILDQRAARKILTTLREKGEAEVPQLTVMRNRPCWQALRLFLDVFVPVETETLQNARWVQRRRLLTLAELETRQITESWDKDFCTALYDQRGKAFGALNDYRSLPVNGNLSTSATGRTLSGTGTLPGEHYVEVWDAYYLGLDRRTRAPMLMHTIWSPLVPEEYARHEPMGYQHGQQPFIELVRERVESALDDSRSVPEIASTFQNTIKTQRDAGNDLAQMTTVPPLLVPMWRAQTPVKLGPGAQIPEKSANEMRWMPPPAYNGAENRSEEKAGFSLAHYFGLIHKDVPQQLITLKQERLVTSFLGEVAQGMRMTLQLAQQYMSDTEAERVVGRLRLPFKVSREEIQGQFTLLLNFDAQNLNPELVKAKLEGSQKYVIAFDTEGVVNRGALARMGANLLDPFMADEIVGTPEAAAQSEVEDEKKNLMMIMSGVEPPMRPEGQNYQLRLQTLMQEVQVNPYLPQRLAAQPDSQAMLQARIQHLQTLAEQFGVNREIGRTGAEPGLSKLREQAQKEAPALVGGAA